MASAGSNLQIIVEDARLCTPCKKIEKSVKPEYYCTDCEAYFCEHCFEFHNRIPLLSKHIVLKGKDINVWETLPYKCKAHDKSYDFFCRKHDLLCCHICVSLQHSTCSNMEYIPEKAKGICRQSELNEMKLNTDAEIKRIGELKGKFSEKAVMNMYSKQEFVKKLKEHRELINSLLDSLERRTLEYMDKKLSDNNIYSTRANSEIQRREAEVCLLKNQLDSSSPEKGVLVFICLKRGEQLLADLRRELSKLDASTNRDNFQLVIHPEIEHFVRNVTDLGRLVDEQAKQDSASDEYEPMFQICTKCGRQFRNKRWNKECCHCVKK